MSLRTRRPRPVSVVLNVLLAQLGQPVGAIPVVVQTGTMHADEQTSPGIQLRGSGDTGPVGGDVLDGIDRVELHRLTVLGSRLGAAPRSPSRRRGAYRPARRRPGSRSGGGISSLPPLLGE